MKKIILLLCLMLSFNTFSRVEIKLLRGDVTIDGKKVTQKTKMFDGGVVKTGKKGFIKLFSKKYNSNVFVGPNSEMKIKFAEKKIPFTLIDGVSRWVTQGDSKLKGGIKTTSVIFGVRGTDFVTIANKVLGESEIVCFDGKVKMQNRKNKKDNALVGKNQWGGIGGRFGKSIGKVLDLPKSFIKSAKTLVPTK